MNTKMAANIKSIGSEVGTGGDDPDLTGPISNIKRVTLDNLDVDQNFDVTDHELPERHSSLGNDRGRPVTQSPAKDVQQVCSSASSKGSWRNEDDKIILPDSSLWSHMPRTLFPNKHAWEIFGVKLEPIVHRRFSDLFEEARFNCLGPEEGSTKRESYFAAISHVFLELRQFLKKEKIEGEKEKLHAVLGYIPVLLQKIQEAPQEVILWIPELCLVLDLLARVMQRLSGICWNFTQHKGGGEPRLKGENTAQENLLEKDYKAALQILVGCVFRSDIREEQNYEQYLYPLCDEYVKKSLVHCKADLEVKADVCRPHGVVCEYPLLEIEIKKEQKKNSTMGQPLMTCYPTIYQHFCQLLVTLPGSFFAQKWDELHKTDDNKLPHNAVNYIFGMMMHNTEIHFTCLKMSKSHMRKVMHRKKNVTFAGDQRGSGSSIDSGDMNLGRQTLRDIEQKDKLQGDEEVGDSDCEPGTSSDEDAGTALPDQKSETLFVSLKPLSLLSLDGIQQVLMLLFELACIGKAAKVTTSLNF